MLFLIASFLVIFFLFLFMLFVSLSFFLACCMQRKCKKCSKISGIHLQHNGTDDQQKRDVYGTASSAARPLTGSLPPFPAAENSYTDRETCGRHSQDKKTAEDQASCQGHSVS